MDKGRHWVLVVSLLGRVVRASFLTYFSPGSAIRQRRMFMLCALIDCVADFLKVVNETLPIFLDSAVCERALVVSFFNMLCSWVAVLLLS